MSSRNQQTKSLDRDFYRGKRKMNCSQNVEKINNTAEKVICHLHQHIEDIFNQYPVKRFSEELSADKLTDIISDLGTRIDCEEPLNLKIAIKDDLLNKYLDFVIDAKALLHGINSLLSQTIRNGLLRYCFSLAVYCTSEIDFVRNYEKIIQKNSPDIIKELDDISRFYEELRKYLINSRSVLYHYTEIINWVEKIRACINKLYYMISEWVDEERDYSKNLSNEMKLVKSEMFIIQQRIVSNRDSISVRQEKLVNSEKHLKTVMKQRNILKYKYRQIEYSLEQIDFKTKRLTEQESARDSELSIVNQKLKNLKTKSNKAINTISIEMKSAATTQRELQSKQFRFDDNKLALCRHRKRLCKLSNDIQGKIDTSKRDIRMTKTVCDKLKSDLKQCNATLNKDVEKLEKLRPIIDDLNFLLSKKYSPETLRQIRCHGKLKREKKEINIMEKLCDHVARSVADDWREIYLNVPFYPDRSYEQRSTDIEIIDIISARNDYSREKQAKIALNKWRLFYHNATPDHLITGLRKSSLFTATKEVEDLYSQSIHRYDDES